MSNRLNAVIKSQRPAALCFGLLFLLLASCLFSCASPPAPEEERPFQERPSWTYPSVSALSRVYADDFSLSLDGSITLTTPYVPHGVTKAYLEHCMVVTPPAPYTVEDIGKGSFRIYFEDGQTLPHTRIDLPSLIKGEGFSARILPHLDLRLHTEQGYGGVSTTAPIAIEYSEEMLVIGDLRKQITVEPAFPHTLSQEGNRFLLTPTEALPYQATYTVTVSQSLSSVSGSKLDKDTVFQFTTEGPGYSLRVPSPLRTTYPTGEEPIALSLYLESKLKTGCNAEISVMEIQTAEDGRDAFTQYKDYISHASDASDRESYSSEMLAEITTEEVYLPAQLLEKYSRQASLTPGSNACDLPNPGQGYYIIRITLQSEGGSISYYQPLQVTSTDVYLQSNNGETLIWLNDTESGESLAGASLVLSRADVEQSLARVTTHSDGTALLTGFVPPAWEYVGSKDLDPYNTPASTRMTYRMTSIPGLTEEMTLAEADLRNHLPTVFTIYDAQGVPVYTDTTTSLRDGNLRNRYYGCFYVDRALYRPSDTIEFWGFVKPYAYNPFPAPTSVTVRFDPDGNDRRISVPVQPDGTYHGSIRFDKMLSASYEVRAEYQMSSMEQEQRAADYESMGMFYGESGVTMRFLDSTWIEVKDFQTPAYTVSTENDREVYQWGEDVTVHITPTFYDGTPLPDFPVEFSLLNPSTGNLEQIQSLRTDGKGQLTYTFRAGELMDVDRTSWMPRTGYYYVKLTEGGENVTVRGSYTFLPTDTALRAYLQIEGDSSATLELYANRLNVDALRTQEAVNELSSLSYNYGTAGEAEKKLAKYLGAPVNLDATLRLDYGYCKPYDGTYDENHYDYVSKQKNLPVSIQNGKASVANLVDFPRRPNTYLHISLDVEYTQGEKTFVITDYAYNSAGRYSDSTPTAPDGYSFNTYINGAEQPAQQWGSYFKGSYLQAEVGDSLRFALCKDGKEIPTGNGRILYTLAQDRIIERGTARDGFSLQMEQPYANSLSVVAAYFDGRQARPIATCQITLGRENLALSIETETGKESYMPGSQATIKATVTDKDGKPVSASLCFSIVDEAVFALGEQYFDILSELYGEMYFNNQYYYRYASSLGDVDPFNYGNNTDGGKGESDNLIAYDVFRKNFKDTAYFCPATSGADGIASITFTLPDNVTSWRVTTLAVGKNLSGGQAKSNLITTMPFFVKPVISTRYLDGDDFAMVLSGHGTAVEADSAISYTVHVEGDGIDETRTASGGRSEFVQFNFGKLPQGEYTVTSTGQLGQMRDTVQLRAAVIRSNLELIVSKEIDLQKPLDIQAMRYPVTITVFNKTQQAYYKSLNSLLTHYCNRLDQRMSRYSAKHALLKTASAEELPMHLQAVDDLFKYQNADGGIAWYPGGDSEPLLTARAYLAAPEQFNSYYVKQYLLSITEDSAFTPEEQAAAWAAIAAIEPARTSDIHTLLEKLPACTLQEKLYFGVGLAYGGDLGGARAIYEQYVVPNLDRGGGLARMKLDTGKNSAYDSDRATATAWLIANKINKEDADGYSLYFAQRGWRINSLFECMAYVGGYRSPKPSVPSFTYTAGGRTQTLNLALGGQKSIVLQESDMEGLAFPDAPDSLAGIAYYVGDPGDAALEPSDKMWISKQVTPLENNRFETVLTVRFDEQAPYGYYNISDWIPSNARLHSVKRNDGKDVPWIHHEQEGQKMYFSFYRYEDGAPTFTITYYTQRVFESDAVSDHAYLICANSGELAQS